MTSPGATAESATTAPADAYAQTAADVRPPPETFGTAIRKIGPGLILAGAIVGTGELIATTNLGARVGFALLWLVLVSCFLKVFVQIELGRHAISSGETTLASFKKLPAIGTFFTWWWLVMMLGTQSQMGAMVGGVGQSIHMVVPGVSPWIAEMLGTNSGLGKYLLGRPEMLWSVVTAVGTSAALALGSYKLVEVGTTIMVVGFTFMTVVCVGFLPADKFGAAQLAEGLAFTIPEGAAVAAIAMFGITGVGAAELIVYPYWCIEKGYARYVGKRDESETWAARARGWLRVMYLDAWVSMIIYMLATVAFYILGASILHASTGGKGLPGSVDAMLNLLSEMYVPMLGGGLAKWVVVGGAFAVLYSTLFASTAANSRAAADFLQVNNFVKFRTPDDRTRWVRWLCIGFPILDLGLYIFVQNPVLLVTIGAVGQALSLPMIAFAALYLRYRGTDKRLQPGKVWDVFLFFSAFAFVITAAYVMYDTYSKLAK